VIPALARRPVWAAALTVAVVLALTSNRYGFERDELYFAMLRPAWGYVDQPPLTPLLAHLLGGSDPWLLRVPATLAAGASVVVVALLARELGGGRRAQAWTAWGYAGTSSALLFGHVFLTATFDIVVWPIVCLFVFLAERRHCPQWWLAAGAVAGLSTYNKLLIAWLLLGIAAGLLAVGPRARLWSPWVVGGGLVAVVLAAPNLAYQVTHGWPQLDMGRALAENNAGEVRWFMWVLLVLIFGPPLAVVWAAGLRALWRQPDLRFLAVAFGFVVVLTFVSGTQPYYPTLLLPVPFAAGVVALVDRLDRGWLWRGLFALNALVSAVIALPLLPVGVVGSTPIPGLNLTVQDSIGWPAYVDQISRVHDELRDPAAVIVTSNYGEAGAIAHYRPDLPLFSAQNALADQARPANEVDTVVFVGGQLDVARPLFSSCVEETTLDNQLGVDNEEEGQPVAVCRGPLVPWPELWSQLRHLD
jgi:4-amino-4-deoxy-L-arabinose transferase-like glycosyltransferase